MSIIAVYREAFSFEPQVYHLPAGETLADMARRVRCLPSDFAERGTVCVNGKEVPRAVWGLVRPKPSGRTGRIEVTFHLAPMGGSRGGDGTKNPLATIAAIAITVGAAFVTGGGLAPLLGTAFGAGTIGAYALGAGVSLAGSLIVAGLTAPPVLNRPRSPKIDNAILGAASAQGNVLAPNAPIPRVVGTRRIFPPLAAEPRIYFDGDDELVEAVYCLAGPHDFGDIFVGKSRLEAAGGYAGSDLEIETREGWLTDSDLTLVTRQSRTVSLQVEMTNFQVDPDDESKPAKAYVPLRDFEVSPRAHSFTSGDSPDEVQIQLILPQGLSKNASSTTIQRIPFEIQFRRVGDVNWIVCPEIQYVGVHLRPKRLMIRFLWSPATNTQIVRTVSSGWLEAFNRFGFTPATVPGTELWYRTCDSYFDIEGAALKGAKNIEFNGDEAIFYLDPDVFEPGRYEFSIKRGSAFLDSSFNSDTRLYDGNSIDFFVSTFNDIPVGRKNVTDTVVLPRAVSIWNEPPVGGKGLALIAVRARNRAVEELAVEASGYVRDWSGSAWDNWVTTSNPAPHLRDIYAGALNADPVPETIIDDTMLTEWRSACATAGYECNAILEGESVLEAARLVSSPGYAAPYMSEVWGVVRDYDRSAEGPVQVFTPRNSSGFSWRKGFARRPDGFLVTFADRNEAHEPRQIVEPPSAAQGLLEEVSFEAIDTEDAARARAQFDLRQALWRSTFYTITAPAEAIVCRRGSLVGVVHDSLSEQFGAARVVDYQLDGAGDVTALTLDGEVPTVATLYIDQVANLATEPNLADLGRRTGVLLRRTDGTKTVHELSNTNGVATVLTFATPITAAGIDLDILISVGPLAREFERMLVFGIEAMEDLTARLTLVDEAQEIWA